MNSAFFCTPAVGMAVTGLRGDQLFEAGLVLVQYRLAESFDDLADRRVVGGIGERCGIPATGSSRRCEYARDGQIATGNLHRVLPNSPVSIHLQFGPGSGAWPHLSKENPAAV